MFQFSCRFAFVNFSSFKLKAKITRTFDAVSSTDEPTLTRCNFFKHIPKLVIFGTHNLQTFKHNTLISELLLMQFYLFNIRPKLHPRSDKNYASHCSELSQLHQQPVDAVLHPTLIRKLCYKLPSVIAFTFIQTFDQNFVFFTKRHHVDRQCDAKFSKFAFYFLCPVWKTKSW